MSHLLDFYTLYLLVSILIQKNYSFIFFEARYEDFFCPPSNLFLVYSKEATGYFSNISISEASWAKYIYFYIPLNMFR